MIGKYRVGAQPCADYTPQADGNLYATWANVHQCIYCEEGLVSFCEKCHTDHHAGGSEACWRLRRELEARKEDK